MLLSLPNLAWSQVHSFSQCTSSWFETIKPATKYYMWSQGNLCRWSFTQNIIFNSLFFADLWLWPCKSSWSRSWSYWFPDRVCRHTLVSSARNYAEFKGCLPYVFKALFKTNKPMFTLCFLGLHKIDWYLVCWMYLGGDAFKPAHFPRKTLSRSA